MLKTLLNMQLFDDEQDNILNYNIRKSQKAIKKYSRITDEELLNYNDEVVDLAYYYYQNQKSMGVKNESQSNRSKSYEIVDIPMTIKSRLPLPSIRMF